MNQEYETSNVNSHISTARRQLRRLNAGQVEPSENSEEQPQSRSNVIREVAE